jgi:hypothetical protein
MRSEDPVLVLVASLPDKDVSLIRAERLRARCQARLARVALRSRWQRVVGPALAGVWSAVYLVEIVRRAVAIYAG